MTIIILKRSRARVRSLYKNFQTIGRTCCHFSCLSCVLCVTLGIGSSGGVTWKKPPPSHLCLTSSIPVSQTLKNLKILLNMTILLLVKKVLALLIVPLPVLDGKRVLFFQAAALGLDSSSALNFCCLIWFIFAVSRPLMSQMPSAAPSGPEMSTQNAHCSLGL